MMSEIDGTVKFGASRRATQDVIIGDDGEEREYDIPRGAHQRAGRGSCSMPVSR